MKNKYLKMLLVSSLSVFLLFGCGSKEEAPKETSTQNEQAKENEPVKPVITDSITLDNEPSESSSNNNQTDSVDNNSTSNETNTENSNSTNENESSSNTSENENTTNENVNTDDNKNDNTSSNENSNSEEENENLTSENKEEPVSSDSESEEVDTETPTPNAPVALLDEVVISKVEEAISTIFNTDYSDKSKLTNIDSYINNNFVPEAKEKMLSKLSEYNTKISFSDLSITSVKKVDSLDERYPYSYDITYNITVNKDKPSIFNDITATAFSDEEGNLFFQSLNFGEF